MVGRRKKAMDGGGDGDDPDIRVEEEGSINH
jgi:hypothetical protein